MVARKYGGILNPEQRFEALKPYSLALGEMASHYSPASAQYAALHHAKLTLRTAAELITRQPWQRLHDDVGYRPPVPDEE
jgi:hypothetical protein